MLGRILFEIDRNFEGICESVHNGWLDEKIKQGVSNHPDMIPYSQLTEEVKEYNRVTVRRVLASVKWIIKKVVKDSWISTDDRLPKKSGEYLVSTDGVVMVLNYSARHKRFNASDYIDYNVEQRNFIKCEAWQPVPRAYKRKNEV